MKKTLIVSLLLFCAGIVYGQIDYNPAMIIKDAKKTVIEVKKEEIKPAADTVKDPNKTVTDIKISPFPVIAERNLRNNGERILTTESKGIRVNPMITKKLKVFLADDHEIILPCILEYPK